MLQVSFVRLFIFSVSGSRNERHLFLQRTLMVWSF